MPPKVSVNICCYNSEQFIQETIESVLAQTFKDFEVVIIDDGSKDQTAEIINRFNDPRLRYFYQENQGLSAARNKAIKLSKGKFIALLDHDDLWETNKLKIQVRLLDSKPEVGLVFADAYLIDANNKTSKLYFDACSPHRGRVVEQLVKGDFIPCLTVVMRRDIVSSTGSFKKNLHITEEYDFFLRMSLATEFDYVDQPLARYRLHAGNVSQNLERLHKEEILSLEEFARLVKDLGLKKKIAVRLSAKHLALAIFYLLNGKAVTARKEIKLASTESKKSLYACFLYAVSYLPVLIVSAIVFMIEKVIMPLRQKVRRLTCRQLS